MNRFCVHTFVASPLTRKVTANKTRTLKELLRANTALLLDRTLFSTVTLCERKRKGCKAIVRDVPDVFWFVCLGHFTTTTVLLLAEWLCSREKGEWE